MNSIAGMLVGKGYVPVIRDTFTEKALVEHANMKGAEIFYFVGHAGSSPTNEFLIPSESAGVVMPNDIHANARIVFLNACETNKMQSFESSFNINSPWFWQYLPNQPEPRVLLGWSDKIGAGSATYLGWQFWRNMSAGRTVKESADKLGNKSEYTDTQNTSPLKLIITPSGYNVKL